MTDQSYRIMHAFFSDERIRKSFYERNPKVLESSRWMMQSDLTTQLQKWLDAKQWQKDSGEQAAIDKIGEIFYYAAFNEKRQDIEPHQAKAIANKFVEEFSGWLQDNHPEFAGQHNVSKSPVKTRNFL